MSRLLVRLLLAMVVVPTAVVVYFVSFILFESQISLFFAFIWSGAFTWLFAAAAWLAIWRESVRWTTLRKWGTLLLAPLALLAGVLLGTLGTAGLWGPEPDLIAFIASTLAILFWLGSTALLWQETAAERAERLRQSAGDAVRCPRCGYNLTGLYEAACPECGSRFTLDQLYGAQHREVIADAAEAGIEREKA